MRDVYDHTNFRGSEGMKTLHLTKVTASVAALILWTGAALAGPLGELVIQGDVRLSQQGSSERITLSNTTYSLFSGDRVATGSSPASLRMGSGNSLALGPNSEATLSMNGSHLQAELVSGTMAVMMDASSMMRVNGRELAGTGELAMIEMGEAGDLLVLQGGTAQDAFTSAGLELGAGGIGLICKDPSQCESSRPMSLSP
jgi:hypothetical protein